MIHLGGVDVHGNRTGYNFTAKRVGNMLVLEFINNAIIAFEVKVDAPGVYALLFRGLRVLTVSSKDFIDIKLYSPWSPLDADLLFSSNGGSFHIRAIVSGGARYSLNNGGYSDVRDVDLKAYYKARGVEMPVGVAFSRTISSRTFGYDFKFTNKLITLRFPNSLAFPIILTDFGIRVVNTDICAVRGISCVFVRVKEYSASHIVFRLIFVADGNVIWCDNVRVDGDGATYGKGHISSTTILKILMLYGGS